MQDTSMDIPQPPQDTDLKNIIDKLAQFVARNGPEFEQMTKNKQKGNPKFQFLYGGEYFNYYQYKVAAEQAIVKQQQQQGIINNTSLNMNEQSNSWNAPSTVNQQHTSVEVEHIVQQQDALREQIKQSEQNLSAQHTVLMQQQQAQVEAAVAKYEAMEIQKDADICGIILEEVDSILQPIIDTCTKDSISNGKSWFLQHATNKEKANCIVKYLLQKVLQASKFSQKLHVIYLVNDLLHHTARKNANELKEALEGVVVPMFCNASIAANEEQSKKLEKLLKLWESKANYLKQETLDKMRDPIQSYQQFQADQVAKFSNEVSTFTQQTKNTFDGYQAQHQAFVCHAMQQIMDLQQQKQNIEQQQKQQQQQQQHQIQQQQTVVQQAMESPQTTANIIPLETIQATLQQTIQSLSQTNTTNSLPQKSFETQVQHTFPIQSNDTFMQMNTSIPPPNIPSLPNQVMSDISLPSNGMDNPFSQPPPGFMPPPGMFPDFSKPPPGFAPKPEPVLEDLIPTAPYYDLPAGLMVPLVKLEDTEYKPLDPKDIRLPAPAPPSERLLAAVEAFYSLPSHDRPRDSEGWEKLGLYEYYKAKNQAKREKDEAIKAGLRMKSRTPSPVQVVQEKENTPPKRRYRSRTPSPAPPPIRERVRRSRSRSRSKSRSRSRSPRRRRSIRDRDARSNRRRSFSRSRSRSPPIRRSPSPPAFRGPLIQPRPDLPLHEVDQGNKGHQMLMRMGWSGGGGLGAREQGSETPVGATATAAAGERDRRDQFRGVGCPPAPDDPFESFRRNKGAAFITRMKARAEERDKESK